MLILLKATEANITHLSTYDFVGHFLKGYFMKLLISDIKNNTEDIHCTRLHLKTYKTFDASLLKASLQHKARKPQPKAKVKANS